MGKSKNYTVITIVSISTVVSSIFILFFFYRFNFNLNTPIKNWIDTATYFNNLLSPLFLFVTIMLLYWTWRDTKNGLELQRQDSLYNSTIGIFSRYVNDYFIKLEKPLSDEPELCHWEIGKSLQLIGGSYLAYAESNENLSEDDFEFINRITFLELVHKSTASPSVFATYIFQLYSELSDDAHKKGYLLNLYGKLGIEMLIAIFLIKIHVKRTLEGITSDTKAVDLEINFLKKAALIAHSQDNLESKLFSDELIIKYFNDN
ncbi:hypothetical protein HHE94_02040 [Pseudoalteromonas arctica]|uniref:Phage abortive infection protein n=1 Tax=Pseudoalteromonas arctica TaxID=394751 RepID=A0AAP7CIZ6_9GAMM|nr:MULTISPECIES: hypothetical protein [Pseudoalteromonas]MBG9993055.1 hypothetical protein [Pseudoalteromonas sp. NZS37]NMP01507.1 hypothetical protein [Pseudoalteromonas arctica]